MLRVEIDEARATLARIEETTWGLERTESLPTRAPAFLRTVDGAVRVARHASGRPQPGASRGGGRAGS